MTHPDPALRTITADELWSASRAIGERLEQWFDRLADPDEMFGQGDGAAIDQLAQQVTMLRDFAGSSAQPPPDNELSDLYEGPLFAGALDATLDELAARALAAREQIWQRIGWPAPELSGLHNESLPDPWSVVSLEVAAVDVELALAASPARYDGVHRAPPTDGWRIASEVLTAVGVLIVVFMLYALFGTGLSEARSQRHLDREFNGDLRAAVATASTDDSESGVLGGGAEPEPEDDVAEAEVPQLPERGDPVAIISLPTVGVTKVVVEGTRSADLMSGPGHLRSTPLPGRAGNAVIFGRRTTFGGPFSDIDDLQPGDPMDVTTTQGVFRYVVQEVTRVGPGDLDPIGTTFTNRLTLVTSDEAYSTGGRLVVIGRLDGAPAPTPMTTDGRSVTLPTVTPDELGAKRTGTDWAFILVWSQLLVIVYLGARWLYRHWLPWSTWLVSTPVILVIAFAWLDSLSRIFPSML